MLYILQPKIGVFKYLKRDVPSTALVASPNDGVKGFKHLGAELVQRDARAQPDPPQVAEYVDVDCCSELCPVIRNREILPLLNTYLFRHVS